MAGQAAPITLTTSGSAPVLSSLIRPTTKTTKDTTDTDGSATTTDAAGAAAPTPRSYRNYLRSSSSVDNKHATNFSPARKSSRNAGHKTSPRLHRAHSMHFNFETVHPPHITTPDKYLTTLRNPASLHPSLVALLTKDAGTTRLIPHSGDDEKPVVFRRQYDRLDWKRLAAIDVQQMYKTKNYDALSDNLLQLTFCDVESEIKGGDPRLLQLFKLTQLGLEFLLFNYDRASKALERARKEHHATESLLRQQQAEGGTRFAKVNETITYLRDELKRKKKTIAAQQEILSALSCSSNNYQSCTYCGKSFVNSSFLEKHITSRHPQLAGHYFSSMQPNGATAACQQNNLAGKPSASYLSDAETFALMARSKSTPDNAGKSSAREAASATANSTEKNLKLDATSSGMPVTRATSQLGMQDLLRELRELKTKISTAETEHHQERKDYLTQLEHLNDRESSLRKLVEVRNDGSKSPQLIQSRAPTPPLHANADYHYYNSKTTMGRDFMLTPLSPQPPATVAGVVFLPNHNTPITMQPLDVLPFSSTAASQLHYGQQYIQQKLNSNDSNQQQYAQNTVGGSNWAGHAFVPPSAATVTTTTVPNVSAQQNFASADQMPNASETSGNDLSRKVDELKHLIDAQQQQNDENRMQFAENSAAQQNQNQTRYNNLVESCAKHASLDELRRFLHAELQKMNQQFEQRLQQARSEYAHENDDKTRDLLEDLEHNKRRLFEATRAIADAVVVENGRKQQGNEHEQQTDVETNPSDSVSNVVDTYQHGPELSNNVLRSRQQRSTPDIVARQDGSNLPLAAQAILTNKKSNQNSIGTAAQPADQLSRLAATQKTLAHRQQLPHTATEAHQKFTETANLVNNDNENRFVLSHKNTENQKQPQRQDETSHSQNIHLSNNSSSATNPSLFGNSTNFIGPQFFPENPQHHKNQLQTNNDPQHPTADNTLAYKPATPADAHKVLTKTSRQKLLNRLLSSNTNNNNKKRSNRPQRISDADENEYADTHAVNDAARVSATMLLNKSDSEAELILASIDVNRLTPAEIDLLRQILLADDEVESDEKNADENSGTKSIEFFESLKHTDLAANNADIRSSRNSGLPNSKTFTENDANRSAPALFIEQQQEMFSPDERSLIPPNYRQQQINSMLTDNSAALEHVAADTADTVIAAAYSNRTLDAYERAEADRQFQYNMPSLYKAVSETITISDEGRRSSKLHASRSPSKQKQFIEPENNGNIDNITAEANFFTNNYGTSMQSANASEMRFADNQSADQLSNSNSAAASLTDIANRLLHNADERALIAQILSSHSDNENFAGTAHEKASVTARQMSGGNSNNQMRPKPSLTHAEAVDYARASARSSAIKTHVDRVIEAEEQSAQRQRLQHEYDISTIDYTQESAQPAELHVGSVSATDTTYGRVINRWSAQVSPRVSHALLQNASFLAQFRQQAERDVAQKLAEAGVDVTKAAARGLSDEQMNRVMHAAGEARLSADNNNNQRFLNYRKLHEQSLSNINAAIEAAQAESSAAANDTVQEDADNFSADVYADNIADSLMTVPDISNSREQKFAIISQTPSDDMLMGKQFWETDREINAVRNSFELLNPQKRVSFSTRVSRYAPDAELPVATAAASAPSFITHVNLRQASDFNNNNNNISRAAAATNNDGDDASLSSSSSDNSDDNNKNVLTSSVSAADVDKISANDSFISMLDPVVDKCIQVPSTRDFATSDSNIAVPIPAISSLWYRSPPDRMVSDSTIGSDVDGASNYVEQFDDAEQVDSMELDMMNNNNNSNTNANFDATRHSSGIAPPTIATQTQQFRSSTMMIPDGIKYATKKVRSARPKVASRDAGGGTVGRKSSATTTTNNRMPPAGVRKQTNDAATTLLTDEDDDEAVDVDEAARVLLGEPLHANSDDSDDDVPDPDLQTLPTLHRGQRRQNNNNNNTSTSPLPVSPINSSIYSLSERSSFRPPTGASSTATDVPLSPAASIARLMPASMQNEQRALNLKVQSIIKSTNSNRSSNFLNSTTSPQPQPGMVIAPAAPGADLKLSNDDLRLIAQLKDVPSDSSDMTTTAVSSKQPLKKRTSRDDSVHAENNYNNNKPFVQRGYIRAGDGGVVQATSMANNNTRASQNDTNDDDTPTHEKVVIVKSQKINHNNLNTNSAAGLVVGGKSEPRATVIPTVHDDVPPSAPVRKRSTTTRTSVDLTPRLQSSLISLDDIEKELQDLNVLPSSSSSPAGTTQKQLKLQGERDNNSNNNKRVDETTRLSKSSGSQQTSGGNVAIKSRSNRPVAVDDSDDD